ncbi:hypothetical protein [Rhodococcus phenolicus]|uniref:hypothetical protein n=1 Tax=Rhodococcus phenolicus TaxID=263849 RepID=UPI000AF35A64|nr:hypothetical protein [Rhodococcus phenolicus]
MVAKHLHEEQRRGSVPAGVDVDIVCDLVAQFTDGAILEHIQHGRPDDDRALAAEIARIGWLACYGPVPPNLS